ncbi:MAG: hypothetical protein KDE51_03170 [Anaerolineales bacterium]|nr:hypothetical protein [Anaerolineales bacterium]
MNFWSEISQENLLSRSQEQEDFLAAIKEWKHTGEVIDHLEPIEICQICEHPKLRYHYEIENRITKAILQVGSSCIEKFNIAVYDSEGNELFGKAKTKQLKEELKNKQQEMMLEPLRVLYKGSTEGERETIEWYVDEFKDRNGFSPRNLLNVFKSMNERSIEYIPHIYKVVVRSDEDKEELYSMSDEEKELIWSSLSTSQQGRYKKGKEAYEKRKAEEKAARERLKEVQQKVSKQLHNRPISSFQSPSNSRENNQPRSMIPDQPIRYVESAHRHKIIFLDRNNTSLDVLIRGSWVKSHAYLEDLAKRYPNCVKVEVRNTETNELINTYSRK